ncbi:MAG: hypothetical protein FD147_2496 [Chloroflexi bacterium]|nr:MAG: hypothetical protein FD147_2496 [Chloroflexota bacterium]
MINKTNVNNLGSQTTKSHVDLFILVLIVIIIGFVYYQTLLPGIGYMGDVAKFQFLGKVLGTPHAPGYPNYLILNHFFVTIFPFGTLAFKANLLSSFFTLGAAVILYLTMRQISVKPLISFSIVLSFCFAKTVWNQSIIAEVYSLNLLYVSLVTYFLLKWNITKRDRFFYFGCFFYAISFGNHLIMISFLPAIVYVVIVTDNKAFINPKKIIAVLLFILIGLSQYYYLYWRTISPDTTYLEVKVNNLQDLFFLLTGGAVFQKLIIGQVLIKIKKFVFYFVRELLFLIPFPLIGFLLSKLKPLRTFILLGFVGNLLISFSYNIDDIWVYLIPSYFFLSILTAIGFEEICSKLNDIKLKSILIFISISPLLFIGINYQRNDMSKNTLEKDYIENVLFQINKNGLIIGPDYDQFEYIKYYLLGEGLGSKNNMTSLQKRLDEISPNYTLCKWPII